MQFDLVPVWVLPEVPSLELPSGWLQKAMDQINEHRDRVLSCCEKYNEIGPLEDGFQYFWIKDRGAMSAADLRVIADELDRRNKDWKEQIERDLSR